MIRAALRLIGLGLGLAALGLAGPAAAETLIVAMSTHRVQISSNYTGDQLAVFGTIERDARTVARADPYDLIVTVRGPPRMLLVREKERVGPIWINRTQRRFPEGATFLYVASTRPMEQIVSPETARRERIGLPYSLKDSELGLDLDPTTARFREGLIRIMENRSLYNDADRGVNFLSQTLFSARIDMPGAAPTGTYEVDVALYAGGVPLARQSTHFEVIKTGMEDRLATGAHDWPLVYGLATILLALLLGWAASVIFRRD